VLAPIRAPLLVRPTRGRGVHFRSRWLSPRELGRRAFEVSASDRRGDGGRVVAAVLALAARRRCRRELRAIVAVCGTARGAPAARSSAATWRRARELSLTIAVVGARCAIASRARRRASRRSALRHRGSAAPAFRVAIAAGGP